MAVQQITHKKITKYDTRNPNFDPEKFEEWSNLKSQNAEVNEKFGASEEQIGRGKAIQEFEVTAKRRKEGKAGVETLGKTLEADVSPTLDALEKRKAFTDRYNAIQNMSKEELEAEGLDEEQIKSAQWLGKLAQAYTGDFNVMPTWSSED